MKGKPIYKKEFRRILLTAVYIALVLAAAVMLEDSGVSDVFKPSAKGGVEIPIVMYHSVLADPTRSNKFTISPEAFENDLLFIKEKGYETIVFADLIAYVDKGTPLPEKPIMLTFDDGYYNNLIYAMPLLEKHGMKAVVSVVGQFADNFSKSMEHNPNYSHLTWEDIALLSESGCFEVQNHSYAMHNYKGERKGVERKRLETHEQYKKFLLDDVSKMQEKLKELSGVTATAFAYPFGIRSEEADEIFKEIGIRATLSSYEHMNIISDADSLYSLGRYNRPGGMKTEDFMKKIIP